MKTLNSRENLWLLGPVGNQPCGQLTGNSPWGTFPESARRQYQEGNKRIPAASATTDAQHCSNVFAGTPSDNINLHLQGQQNRATSGEDASMLGEPGVHSDTIRVWNFSKVFSFRSLRVQKLRINEDMRRHSRLLTGGDANGHTSNHLGGALDVVNMPLDVGPPRCLLG